MEQDAIVNPKKLAIIGGAVLLVAIITWIVVSIIDGSTLRIKNIYNVRSDFPFLAICFNKTIKNEESTLKTQDFTVKNRVHYDDKCNSFYLAVKDGGINEGKYSAVLSAESDSGQIITNSNIDFEIVNSNGKNTLSDDDIAKLTDSNNDAEVEEWMSYWREQPIYQHVDSTSFTNDGAMWTIALRADENNNPIILIYLNMPQPPQNRPVLIQSAEQYKKAALEQIRGWGVSPDDYTIDYRFDG